jgi:acetolactate synthase-1/2/3 large subunit
MSLLKQLAADIHRHGTRAVFGITGSGQTLTLLDELEKLGVESVRTHFEACGALMAGTVGRLSGRAGVAFSIKGPGLTNMIPGIAAAALENFPLVAICEAYSPLGPRKAHKSIDQAQLVGALVKGERYLSEGACTFEQLAAWAEAEVPAPVVLQLTAEANGESRPVPAFASAAAHGDELSRLIERSRRPVIIAGSLVLRRKWAAKLRGLKIPIFSTAAAKGVLDEFAPTSAGVYTGVGLERTTEHHVLPHADLVIGLGLRPAECLVSKPFTCPSVNVDPAGIVDTEKFAFAATRPDLPEDFWDAIGNKEWGQDMLAEAHGRLRSFMLDGFLPGSGFAAIEEVLGSSVRLVMDTGNFCTIGEHAWRAPAADLCLLSGQSRYMGTSVPMALGAAIHDPATPLVAVAGDGGLAMFLAEFRIAVERKLPILFVLMSDGRFGSIAGRALREGLTLKPIDIREPSWMAPMAALGMPAWQAREPGRLHDALSAWRSCEGPGYLEIVYDSDQCQRMCNGIR